MKINGYELALSEAQLDEILETKTKRIDLVSKDFEGYKNLTEGNKKALEHLVAAARCFNDVSEEQDHEMNLVMKRLWNKLQKKVRMRRKHLNCFILSAVSRGIMVLIPNRFRYSKD